MKTLPAFTQFVVLLSLPLLLVLGACSKAPVVESENEGQQQQEVKEEVKTEEPVAESKPAEAVSVNPNLKYEIKDGTVTITDCDTSASGELEIPDTIDGNPVAIIGEFTFRFCTDLTSITIPDSVTSIGGSAFSDCANLTSIEVGAGNVNYTGVNGVLFNAEKTMLLTYPEGKTDANYTIPNSVTSIGKRAFFKCNSLTSITIPASVTSIDRYAFGLCNSLTSITIPASVTSIGERAFMDCSSLTSIEVGAGNVNYASVNGVLFNAEKAVLLTYPASKTGANYTIPDSVTLIEAGAFEGCRSLTSITIPDSVSSIEDLAFGGCHSLTNITIPDGVTSIGNAAFSSCRSLTSIRIPDSVTSIGDSAFFFCGSLTSITIPDGVTSIGNSAFMGCKSLTSITIPDSVTSIGDYAFRECESLTPVTFLGDAPKAAKNMFFATSVTIYRKSEAKGWGDTFAGRPVKLISEKP